MTVPAKLDRVHHHLNGMDDFLESLSGLTWILMNTSDAEEPIPNHVTRTIGRALSATLHALDHERQEAEVALNQHMADQSGRPKTS